MQTKVIETPRGDFTVRAWELATGDDAALASDQLRLTGADVIANFSARHSPWGTITVLGYGYASEAQATEAAARVEFVVYRDGEPWELEARVGASE